MTRTMNIIMVILEGIFGGLFAAMAYIMIEEHASWLIYGKYGSEWIGIGIVVVSTMTIIIALERFVKKVYEA